MAYDNGKPKKLFIEMKNIVKSFSGIRALSDITFDVEPGEIHCLVGENGAGKSTLMKILSGAYKPDSGEIVVDETSHPALSPQLAQELGINIIYQENLLVPTMNIIENIFIGHEMTSRLGFIDRKTMVKRTKAEMDFLGIELNPYRTIENLSVAEQQFVKILKTLVMEPKLLIMDEPTSMFNVEDANRVLKLVKRITEKGISIIYISHFLKEVVQIADRITVLRDGAVVNTMSNGSEPFDMDQITRDMVGRPVELFYNKEASEIGDIVLEVNNLQLQQNSPTINFNLREGEILGIAGMVGAGRTEIVRAISGADWRYKGNIVYKGKELKIENPKDGIKAGIAHITEDRQRLGLMLEHNIVENMTVVGLDRRINGFFLNVKKHVPLVEPIAKDLNVKTSSMYKEVRFLSGGNQQKVVLGKWLFADADIFIFDEPTRGIDVNSKTEFYKLMSALTKQGKSIILISSDMPELVSMSDRVLVIRKGDVSKELTKDQITEEAIIKSALEENVQ
ncbi:sugar ABC transporter ATP-binding protein [Virgibacillus sp. W0181]|uniref:sugar ABC transporter ATP-binding protein n=1 Tax=Virgibacillus sp. W0181 TaxID=3391581 RepID=UPI003F45FF2C